MCLDIIRLWPVRASRCFSVSGNALPCFQALDVAICRWRLHAQHPSAKFGAGFGVFTRTVAVLLNRNMTWWPQSPCLLRTETEKFNRQKSNLKSYESFCWKCIKNLLTLLNSDIVFDCDVICQTSSTILQMRRHSDSRFVLKRLWFPSQLQSWVQKLKVKPSKILIYIFFLFPGSCPFFMLTHNWNFCTHWTLSAASAASRLSPWQSDITY